MELEELKAETAKFFAEFEGQGDLPALAVAVFRFAPEGPDADWDAFSEAAEDAGFDVSWYDAEGEDEACIEVETPPGAPSLAWLWSWEEPLILLGALHGFATEGWAIEPV